MWNSGKKALGDLLWGNGLRCVHALRCFPPAFLLPCQPSLPHLLLSSAPFRFDQMAGKYKSPYFFILIWLCNSLHTLLNQIEHFTRALATEVRQHVEASLKDCSNSYHMPPPSSHAYHFIAFLYNFATSRKFPNELMFRCDFEVHPLLSPVVVSASLVTAAEWDKEWTSAIYPPGNGELGEFPCLGQWTGLLRILLNVCSETYVQCSRSSPAWIFNFYHVMRLLDNDSYFGKQWGDSLRN